MLYVNCYARYVVDKPFSCLLGNITRDRNLKQKLLRDNNDPVTGLAFKTTGKNIHLFVATVESVLQYNVTVKDKEKEVLILVFRLYCNVYVGRG